MPEQEGGFLQDGQSDSSSEDFDEPAPIKKSKSYYNSRVVCAVPKCITNKHATRPKHVSFHRIPKDPFFSEMWFQSIGLTKPLHRNARYCSEHFTPESFFPTYSHSTGFFKRIRLKKNAVPTRNLPLAAVSPSHDPDWLKKDDSDSDDTFDDSKNVTSEWKRINSLSGIDVESDKRNKRKQSDLRKLVDTDESEGSEFEIKSPRKYRESGTAQRRRVGRPPKRGNEIRGGKRRATAARRSVSSEGIESDSNRYDVDGSSDDFNEEMADMKDDNPYRKPYLNLRQRR